MPYASEHTPHPHEQRIEQHAAGSPLSRRAVLGKGLTAGAAALITGAAVRLSSAGAQDGISEHHTSEAYVTTAPLNLRTGAGSTYRVILVMPKGARITLNQRYQNGYYSVTYKGQLGWAHKDYIARAGTIPTDPVITGRARTLNAVNLRSGPSTGNQALRVVPAGSWVDTSGTVRNGFRYVVHQDLAGWIADQYLSWPSDGGETFTTTARLNLRAQPSTSAKVLLIMPEGSTVQAGSGTAPGFRQVTFKGTTGWASTNYLN